jgi:hypothetical protein
LPYYAYRLLRSLIPETLTLKLDGMIRDTTIATGLLTESRGWKSLFSKRTIVVLDKLQLASLRPRETDSGNHPTVDANGRAWF